jgi:hypothetical protein
MHRTVKEDNFEMEEETGAINVHVMIQPETFAEYPESYFDLPEAREYVALNPRYREGRDLAYAFPFSAANVFSMAWRCWQQNRRSPQASRVTNESAAAAPDIKPLTCPSSSST